jgi:hypothetical protein
MGWEREIMAKFLKDTPVFMACPACGETQRAKLKWAKHHKALKCKDCKESIDLRGQPFKGIIAKTAGAAAAFEKALDSLRAAAERQGKAHKKSRKDRKAKKAKRSKSAKPKRAASKSAAPAAKPIAKPAAQAAKPVATSGAAPELKPGQWPA